ncbi:MAG: glycosyltransferase family 39 protein, partial [Candidatus Omnitrophota bacterium]
MDINPKRQINQNYKISILFFIIVAVSLVLRIYNFDKFDLWYDELISNSYTLKLLSQSAIIGRVSLFETFRNKFVHDLHSVFYYPLVYSYSIFFGEGKSLRIISLIFSLLSVFIFYKLSRLFLKPWESLLAISLMVLSPFHIWYAQEARAYAMICFFSIAMLYFYFIALKNSKISYWVFFYIAAILAVYSSYYSVFLIVFSSFFIFFKENRKHFIKWLVCICLILISCLPLLAIFTKQLDFIKNSFWLPKPTLEQIPFTLGVFSLGYSASYPVLIIGTILFSALFLWGFYSYYRLDKKEAFSLLLLIILPIILTYVLSKFIIPIYIYRQLIIFSPIYYIFMAKGIAGIRGRKIRLFICL